jgi:molecular chaperone GrpE
MRSARPSTFLSAARPQPSIAASIRRPQQFSSTIRWYSDAAPDAKKEEGAAEGNGKAPEASADAAKLKEELEKKDKEIIDLKDKYLRSIADFRNLQTQTKREVSAAKSFALQSFARDLIESVDNLDRALTNVPGDKLTEENKDLVLLHDGLKMTENILMQTLKKHGLERVDPSVQGEKFDPNVHEAVFQTPQPGKEDGTVFHTQQKGFMYNGRVLRAAKVGVVRNS